MLHTFVVADVVLGTVNTQLTSALVTTTQLDVIHLILLMLKKHGLCNILSEHPQPIREKADTHFNI